MPRVLIDSDVVDDIALGSEILASGGSGDQYQVTLWVKSLLEQYGPVPLIGVDEVPRGLVVPVAMMGSPRVAEESLYYEHALLDVIRTVEAEMHEPVAGILPIEGAGSNTLIAVAAASTCGVSCIDGDGMGRAFPFLSMTSWALAGLSPNPTVLVDEYRNQIVCRVNDGWAAEEFARAVTISMGGSSYLSAYAGSGQATRDATVSGTLTRTLELARVVQTLLSDGELPREFSQYGFMAQVTEVLRDRKPHVASLTSADGEGVVEFGDQYQTVTMSGRLWADVPDVISCVDSISGEPIPADTLHPGQRVFALRHRAPTIWYHSEGLNWARAALCSSEDPR